MNDTERMREVMEIMNGFKDRCWELEAKNKALRAKANMDEAIMAGDNALINGLKAELATLRQKAVDLCRYDQASIWKQNTKWAEGYRQACSDCAEAIEALGEKDNG